MYYFDVYTVINGWKKVIDGKHRETRKKNNAVGMMAVVAQQNRFENSNLRKITQIIHQATVPKSIWS